ncbi:hypothetical protein [Marinoscillum furvescens]|uniref:Uncharacterized protein n=1 Tax=Marinoscillum furvescens DSM 4134 TaxID=1122208 RepID=A0A3D9KZC2_MARFU|nr:hypothetical protein [Marinoscillum furvescens]RED94372.1 hypothetical protein C7460_12159 [Marinoscillum furvescens DSM 4134]
MRKFLVMIMLVSGVLSLRAQDETTFTDEELQTYASVMVWAEQEKAALSSIVSDSVAIWLEESPLDNAKYNELSKADKKDDLASVEATPEQVEAYKEVKARIAEKTANFKETYVGKIKGDIGAGLYNKLKAALKKDEEVKERYQAIYEELKAEAAAENDEEAEEESPEQ